MLSATGHLVSLLLMSPETRPGPRVLGRCSRIADRASSLLLHQSTNLQVQAAVKLSKRAHLINPILGTSYLFHVDQLDGLSLTNSACLRRLPMPTPAMAQLSVANSSGLTYSRCSMLSCRLCRQLTTCRSFTGEPTSRASLSKLTWAVRHDRKPRRSRRSVPKSLHLSERTAICHTASPRRVLVCIRNTLLFGICTAPKCASKLTGSKCA